MAKDLKLIIILFATFTIAFLTTLLLELPIFKHWLRQSLVILFVMVQLYMGFILLKFIKEN